eukprot:408539-Prymnesium_polylepis.2
MSDTNPDKLSDLANLGLDPAAHLRANSGTRQPRPLPSTASRLAVILASPPGKTVKVGTFLGGIALAVAPTGPAPAAAPSA